MAFMKKIEMKATLYLDISLRSIAGVLLTLLLVLPQTVKGGKCGGAYAGQHFCFGNGKRSKPMLENPRSSFPQGPISNVLFGDRTNGGREIQNRYPEWEYPVMEDKRGESKQWNEQELPRVDSIEYEGINNQLQSFPAENEREINEMWQRLRNRLIKEKAKEIYFELEELAEEDQRPMRND